MTIICKICQAEFPKIIPWQHLRKHGINSSDYKRQHGPLYSQDTLDKHRARIPHNKGSKLSDDELNRHRACISAREKRYQSGELVRHGKRCSDETKAKISASIKQYASKNHDELSNRAYKAISTKMTNGNDIAPFRGRRHTDEAKAKISEKSKTTNKIKTTKSWGKILALADEYNLTLLSDVGVSPLQLQCNTCRTEFSFTKQYFHPAKTFAELCPSCWPRTIKQSASENELYEFVRSICSDAIQGYREHYHSLEIDIFIPSLNIGIEYDGLYWHSEEVLLSIGRSKFRAAEKHAHFRERGIRLISIYSDEWKYKPLIIKDRLRAILGDISTRIYAKDCEIRAISECEASNFCEVNHIMGDCHSTVRLGLFHSEILVSVMTCLRLPRNSSAWEMSRFSSSLDTIVVGGASKLFAYFTKTHDPLSVLSLADNRWSSGHFYDVLGFTKTTTVPPTCWYFAVSDERRFLDNDGTISSNFDVGKRQKYMRIWDCGQTVWEWRKK